MVVSMTYAADGQRRRGRPPRISRDDIVDAACELGIENLTMAAVAERLGVTHQSLYGWVRDRDELIDLVSDRLIRQPTPPTGGTRSGHTPMAFAVSLTRCRASPPLAWAGSG
jgi:AcrR family transcriptional regulator